MAALDLSAIPFVDGHMHPPLVPRPATAADYAWPWYEGNPEYVELSADLVPHRHALRQLSAILDCEAHEDAVIAAVAARGDEAWLADCIRRGNVGGLVADTGYPEPSRCLSVPALRGHLPTAWLLRVERAAEGLVAEAADAGEWLERTRAACRAALDDGAAGLKSIVAYRSGLGVAAPDDADVASAFAALRARAAAGGPVRLAVKPLCDAVVLAALDVCRERGCCLQLHAGYGDRDLDLRTANPLELRGLLESGRADGVPLVILHAAYPFVREGALLAAVHEHVYLDIATCIPPLGRAALLECFRLALAIAPLSRIQASSDAAGLIEQVLLGAVRARDALGEALAELVTHAELDAAAAEGVAEAILGGTSRRLYGLA
jgi:hypothetical protein